MATRNELHDMVIESLTEALLQLMKKKPLAQITVSELCKKAGVSRISFYRNFESMQDILIQYLTACTDEWWAEFSTRPESELFDSFWAELLVQYRRHSELIHLIYDNQVSYVMKEHIFSCCGLKQEPPAEDCYARAVLAGAVYGMVDQWIRLGMKEIPEDFSISQYIH